MKVLVDFSEIQSLVKSKIKRDVLLSVVNEQTIRVETKLIVRVPFLGEIDKFVGLTVAVKLINGNDVCLKYNGGTGTDMVVGGLLTILSSSKSLKIMEKMSNNSIVVHLNEFEEVRKILDKVDLKGIKFNERTIVVDVSLRKI